MSAWENLGAKGGASALRSQLDAKGTYKVDRGDATPPKGGDSKFGPDVVPKPPSGAGPENRAMAKSGRLSDVAAIQAMPRRRSDSTKYGIWVEPMESGSNMLCNDPCNTNAGDESMSSAVKYLNRR